MNKSTILSTLLVLGLISTSYTLTINFQGQLRAGLSEFCDNSTLCDSSKGLQCIYGACSCLTAEGFEYNNETGVQRCEGRVNSQCYSDRDCIANAHCSDMFCSCAPGFSPTRTAHCKKNHGSNCTNSSTYDECNEDRLLICGGSSSKCECNGNATNNGVAIDPTSGFCASKIGQGCDPLTDFYGFPTGRTHRKCVEPSLCKRKSEGSLDYSCSCPSGMEAAEDSLRCKETTGKSAAGTLQTAIQFLPLFYFVGMFVR